MCIILYMYIFKCSVVPRSSLDYPLINLAIVTVSFGFFAKKFGVYSKVFHGIYKII